MAKKKVSNRRADVRKLKAMTLRNRILAKRLRGTRSFAKLVLPSKESRVITIYEQELEPADS